MLVNSKKHDFFLWFVAIGTIILFAIYLALADKLSAFFYSVGAVSKLFASPVGLLTIVLVVGTCFFCDLAIYNYNFIFSSQISDQLRLAAKKNALTYQDLPHLLKVKLISMGFAEIISDKKETSLTEKANDRLDTNIWLVKKEEEIRV